MRNGIVTTYDTESDCSSDIIAGLGVVIVGAGVAYLVSNLTGSGEPEKSEESSGTLDDPYTVSSNTVTAVKCFVEKFKNLSDAIGTFSPNQKYEEISGWVDHEMKTNALDSMNRYGLEIYRYILEIACILTLCLRNKWMIYNYVNKDSGAISPLVLIFDLISWLIYHTVNKGSAVKLEHSQNKELQLTSADTEYLGSAISELKAFGSALKLDFFRKKLSPSKVYELIEEPGCIFKTVTPLVTLQKNYKGSGYDFILSHVTSDELSRIRDIPGYLMDDFQISLERSLKEPCAIVNAEREATNTRASLQKFADITETLIKIGKKFFRKP